jgi:ABC-type uncharacterized transport system ATPase subunit
MPPLLRMVGITKRFPGVTANRDITLAVSRGEIHGLLGENGAGKTTLMNILYGLLVPDEGRIEIDGDPVEIRGPRDALSLGIGMVHQHFMLVPDMSVAENVALGLRQGRSPMSNLKQVSERISELSSRYGLNVRPDDLIENLSVGMQQRVEILKLLYRGARLLVLDEPTSVLTPPEWRELAKVLRSLVAEDRAVVFITHKLEELLSVADRCTVLRDGAVVGTVDVGQADKPTLARLMVGREVVLRVDRPIFEPGEPVIEVEGVCFDRGERRVLSDISFAIREREVLAVAGVDGNGQQELVEVLTGIVRPSSGRIRIAGVDATDITPGDFTWRMQGAVIPADRHRTGIALSLPLIDNLMMRDYGQPPYARRGFVQWSKAREHVDRLIAEFDIRTPGGDVWMRQLSGGNQQKAVLARELHRSPRLLIAAQPTRGLDVGAMEFVYRRLMEHKREGGATLVISTELDEVLSLADRIAVIVDGRFLEIIDADEADPERLGLLMAGTSSPSDVHEARA